ncbi:MAG TPA: YigZ family protein, partial [Bacteroidia bacterium]|nr:YigZ family protein [Bacteroidia bacterium]
WILHPDKSAQRASDAGEPANTAGKPILRQITANDLTNTLVVIVRYFGGTLLGAGGLINAYGEAARLAIEAAGTEQKQVEAYFTVRYNYEVENDIFRFIRTVGGNIKSIDKQETVKIEFAVLKKKFETVKSLWNDFRNFELEFNGYK